VAISGCLLAKWAVLEQLGDFCYRIEEPSEVSDAVLAPFKESIVEVIVVCLRQLPSEQREAASVGRRSERGSKKAFALNWALD
jgi:hypothetical protein